jgi:glutamine cyclotransferase
MRALRMAVWVNIVIAAMAIPAQAAVPEYTVTVVKTFPHDPKAFTEGLLYQDGFLYESTGRDSSIRKVALQTGAVVLQHPIDKQYFGEGIVIWNNRLIELTWKNEIGFIYTADTFKPLSDFHYTGEGWALTRDASHLYMSDGTSDLRILNPNSLAEISRIHVTCDGKPVKNINELEWVKGEIYANIWLTNVIVRIDPASGKVVGLVDLTDLTALAGSHGDAIDVPNGIAYDAATNRLFLTGKLWPALYQVTLSSRTEQKNLCAALP